MDKISVSVKKSMQCEPADVEGWGRVLYIHAYVHAQSWGEIKEGGREGRGRKKGQKEEGRK